jgi:hypothetical protein
LDRLDDWLRELDRTAGRETVAFHRQVRPHLVVARLQRTIEIV